MFWCSQGEPGVSWCKTQLILALFANHSCTSTIQWMMFAVQLKGQKWL